jgi:hypothetical protein
MKLGTISVNISVGVINIATQFTDAPGGRFISDGPFSGELFRKELLEPALEKADCVILVTHGLFGLPDSFIDEALNTPKRNRVFIA